MKNKFIWLSASLFCSQTFWGKLLEEGIKPFISSLDCNDIQSYQIKFSYKNGENVRLSLLTTTENFEELKSKADSYFRNHFLKSGYSKIDEQLLKQNIFCPFPLNTIHYGLYQIVYKNEGEGISYKFQEKFSRLIIESFSGKKMDLKSTMIFAFSLHIILIKTITKYYSGSLEEMVGLYKSPNDNEKLKVYSKNFREYRSLLLETTKELWEQDDKGKEKNLSWQKKWVELLEDELIKIVKASPKDKASFFILHNQISAVIKGHLGIPQNFHPLLFFLIKETQYLFHSDFKNQIHNKKDIDLSEKLNHIFIVNQTKNISEKIDKNDIPEGAQEIRLFVIVRNESLRLPYFLEYYSKLGIDRFFIIDNGSTDSTREICLSNKNTHIFNIDSEYKNHWYWMEYFINEYGKDRWCVVVDADELFHFPFSEYLSLKQFVSYLDENKYTAIRSLLLDVYSDKTVENTIYTESENPLHVCPYFDPQFTSSVSKFFDRRQWKYFDSITYSGSMRGRVFKDFFGDDYFYCLSKIPLMKCSNKTYLAQGMHAVNGASIADVQGVVFHTKFISDFVIKSKRESVRGQHYNNGAEYKIYNHHVKNNKDLRLKFESSVKFEDSRQLLELGISKISSSFLEYIETNAPDIFNTLIAQIIIFSNN